MKINIAIADDHRIFRKSFIRFLHDTADIKVVIEASNGADLLEQLTASDKKTRSYFTGYSDACDERNSMSYPPERQIC